MYQYYLQGITHLCRYFTRNFRFYFNPNIAYFLLVRKTNTFVLLKTISQLFSEALLYQMNNVNVLMTNKIPL